MLVAPLSDASWSSRRDLVLCGKGGLSVSTISSRMRPWKGSHCGCHIVKPVGSALSHGIEICWHQRRSTRLGAYPRVRFRAKIATQAKIGEVSFTYDLHEKHVTRVANRAGIGGQACKSGCRAAGKVRGSAASTCLDQLSPRSLPTTRPNYRCRSKKARKACAQLWNFSRHNSQRSVRAISSTSHTELHA